MSSHISTVVRSARPPFLVLPFVSVFLAMAVSVNVTSDIDWVLMALILIGAISAHVSVNCLNEYQDFKSGLDHLTEKTPFSGGSGGLIDHPQSAQHVLFLALGSLALTIIIGLYIISVTGSTLLPYGLIGVATILTYTKWLNRSPLLCLIAPGIAFGPLMILGTQTVLFGQFTNAAFGVSFVMFFQVNNLLLLNQFPDITADKKVGRWHFPIAYGVVNSARVYGIFTFLSCATIVFLVDRAFIPFASIIALFPAATGFFITRAALQYTNDIPKLIPYMGANVGITVLTPFLLALVLLVF
jgi:1,4-dihydroxy-2-naphthoate octaprenyltransferase